MTVQCYMPRDGYPCVGGPADGQMRIPKNGQRVLFVSEMPKRFELTYLRRDDDTPPVLEPIKSHRYELTRVADGGLIWQHKG